MMAYHFFFNDTDGGLLGGTIKAKSYAALEEDLQLTCGNNLSTVCQNQNWCWLQINVNPRIFFTKW